jgi:RimJ/RimL family protein N-acetyltransferase
MYGTSYDPAHFDASLDKLVDDPLSHLFMLFDGDDFAGMSAYLNRNDARQTVEIGNTYYRPHLRGTGFNRRVKAMMLERAFACDYRRVVFCVDIRNARSQAACKKLGAVREGVLRKHKVVSDGFVRDTVMFSVVRDEWPTVEARLRRRIAGQES